MIGSSCRRHSFLYFSMLLSCLLVQGLFFLQASAQVRLGVVGGANFASLSDISANESAVSFDNATAFHGGLFLDINLGPINVRPAVYYLNAGALFEGTSVFTDDNFDMTYVAIPADVVFTFGLGPLKPYFFIGPEFRIFTPSDVPQELEDSIQDFVVNGSTGLGVRIDLPGSDLTLFPHLRYSFGISEYTSSNYQVQGVSISANDANVRMWLLSLGLAF